MRNNQESGPYSLEELLHNTVKASDLIWVEGKSAAWAYPYEIEALKAYVPAPPKQAAVTGSPAAEAQRHTPDSSGRHIFVSLPDKPRKSSPRPASDSLEERAEAIRQRTQQLQPAAAHADATLHTHYARTLDSVEEDYTHWYYNKKVKPRRSYKGVLLIITLGAMLAGGLFAGQSLLKSSNTNTVIPQQKPQPVAATQEQATTPSETPTDTSLTTMVSDTTPVTLPAATPAAPNRTTARNKPVAQPVTQPEPSPATTPETTNEAPILTEDPQPVTPTQPEAPVTVPEKKRKGLLGGLFRKKNEKAEAEPSEGTAERKTKRREDKQPASPTTANLADRLEVRSDATRENWMLGVMGQKITLINHNSQPIKSAMVEVYYFGEDNSLLDRKKISFGTIGPKGQAIAALPDHRQAGRVTFQVLSAAPATEQ